MGCLIRHKEHFLNKKNGLCIFQLVVFGSTFGSNSAVTRVLFNFFFQLDKKLPKIRVGNGWFWGVRLWVNI